MERRMKEEVTINNLVSLRMGRKLNMERDDSGARERWRRSDR